MKKLLLNLTMLLVATLCGGVVQADEVELSPIDGITTVSKSSTECIYDASATSWKINQGAITGGGIGKYNGPYCLVKFDASSLSGKNITDATISFDITAGGYNSSINVAKMKDATWDATKVTFETLSSKSAEQICSGTWSTKNKTVNISYNITNYVSSETIGFAIYTNTGREQTISNIKLKVIYTEAEVYTVTFKESNSLDPNIAIYTDENRTLAVQNGKLLANNTYYYTASKEGYEDYLGSFTVDKDNKEINFTMKVKELFSISFNAVCGEKIIKTLYTNEKSYSGKLESCYAPKYITDENNKVLYCKADNNFNLTQYPTEATTYSIEYTEYKGDAWFVEGENVLNSVSVENGNYSNGHANRGFVSLKDYVTVPQDGIYNMTYAVCNNNVNYDCSVTFYRNSEENLITEKTDIKNISVNKIKTDGTVTVGDITLEKDDVIKVKPSTTNCILDYIFIEKTADILNLSTEYVYSTYCPESDIDFSNVEDVKAYSVKVNGNEITLNEINGKVKAGEGILIANTGKVASVTVPVTTGAESIKDNDLKGVTENMTASELVADNAYILVDDNTFQKVGESTIGTLTKGKAYLQVNNASAAKQMFIVNPTAVNGVKEQTENAAAVIYNAQGMQVKTPVKGLYIVNGKKYIK